MEVWFRPYEKNDKEGCMNAFKSNVPAYFLAYEIELFENFLDKLTDQVIPMSTHYFVLGTDNKIVGCGGFGVRENTDTLTLAWGLIDQNFHKMRLGEKLLEYRIRQIKQLYPTTPVFLDTTQFTYSFFEKYGFQVVKITSDFYAEGMHRYDMVLKP